MLSEKAPGKDLCSRSLPALVPWHVAAKGVFTCGAPCVHVFFSPNFPYDKDTTYIELGLTLITLFPHDYSAKIKPPNKVTFRGPGG